MFTGIIEGKAKVLRIKHQGSAKRLTIELPFHLTEVQLGDSININGACLTIAEKEGQAIAFDLSGETIEKTLLRDLKEGDFVNLERALRLTDRLGGHIVTGHIDGIGVITEKRKGGDFVNLKVKIPESLSKYIVPKGSIAIDGISLTVNECWEEEIRITLIPYTLEKTTLVDKRVGERVNIEADLLGKYVERLLSQGSGKSKGLDLSFLKEHGFIEGE
ncbi:MAG: riboflavin synthase [Thermodesulfobacteriota bacterium]|nr:riboflavin synthase [Thermodesulfobacteriota bacterium]